MLQIQNKTTKRGFSIVDGVCDIAKIVCMLLLIQVHFIPGLIKFQMVADFQQIQ